MICSFAMTRIFPVDLYLFMLSGYLIKSLMILIIKSTLYYCMICCGLREIKNYFTTRESQLKNQSKLTKRNRIVNL